MLHIGRARHPGPGPRVFLPGQLSIEFVNVGGWLTSGDLALDSCAQFLAVAEHRLIPSRARSVCHQLRRAGHHSVWAPACQDKIAGGHAGVGVISLGGAPLSLPSFVTPQFQEFFRLGRVLRTTLPTSRGGVVHLFVVYGYQGAEEDAEKLRLTDCLLQAVLVEAQIVCIGQPMLIAGDLNADPAVIPCLAKGISAGRYVDLALAYSLGAGVAPDVTCRFSREEVLVLVGISLLAVPVLLLLLKPVMLLIDGSLLIFRLLLAFVLMLGWLMLLVRLLVSPFGLHAGWILLIGPLRRPLVLFRMSGMFTEMSLGWFLMMLYLLLGMLYQDLLWMTFGPFGVVMRRLVYFGLILLLEALLLLAALPFLEEVSYVFVAGVWEAELLVVRPRAGFIMFAK